MSKRISARSRLSLTFEPTQLLRIGDIHAAKLGPPLVKTGVAGAALAAQLLDQQAGLGRLDKFNQLFLGKSGLLHTLGLLIDMLPANYAGVAGRGQVRRSGSRIR